MRDVTGSAGPERDATVRLEGVRFRFGNEPVIDDASLLLRAGEFAVLTGPNGSGKTTLLKLCVGLLVPEAGMVEVLGGSPLDPRIRRLIGYAPQGTRVPTSLPVSVREVVTAGLAPSLGPFRRAGAREWDRVETALAAVGLDHLASECLFELSGGEQQRAVLARALVADPRLLLLDEPTTGIDRRLRPVLVEELRARTERGVTVLAVSHDPDELRPAGVRLLVMENGRAREVEPAR